MKTLILGFLMGTSFCSVLLFWGLCRGLFDRATGKQGEMGPCGPMGMQGEQGEQGEKGDTVVVMQLPKKRKK